MQSIGGRPQGRKKGYLGGSVSIEVIEAVRQRVNELRMPLSAFLEAALRAELARGGKRREGK